MRFCLIGKNPEYVLAYRGSLIRAAQARGHEVHALTAERAVQAGDDPEGRLAQARTRLTNTGVTLHTVPMDGGGTNPLRDLATRRAMLSELRSLRPSAVLCYNPKPVAYGPVAARRAGVARVGAMVTGLGYAFTGSGLKRRLIRAVAARLYRKAFKACDVVFFQNRDDLELFTRLGVVPSVRASGSAAGHAPRIELVAGSGVDLERFAQAPLPDPPTVHFVMVARLLRDKGAYEFVDAARLVRADAPKCTFTLVGGIDDNPTAVSKRDLDEWRREGVIALPGEVDDVRDALRSATVFVLPSHREGTSKVMLEAMAIGRAVITTDAVGCREPIEPNRNGMLVPVGDARALAQAMRTLAQNRPLVESMGRESRRIAEERFDARRVDDAILDALGL
ncbi:MAG: glycosyltransferase family 4 protein [Phycisphaeraceae bacterium]|nr:glycosyltransferase family 4 protein [Phycisphaeraceae bacterium]